MNFVHVVLVPLCVLVMTDICSAGRRVAEVQEHEAASDDDDCACYKELKCSSCAFSVCPFEKDSVAHVASREGSDDDGKWHANPLDAAWQVHTGQGHTYVIKFGGAMEAPVKAAQLAHALDVQTPKILTTYPEHCPSLFTGIPKMNPEVPEDFSKLLRRCKSNDCPLSVQEWGVGLNPYDHLSTPWYKAGGVAVLDWLIGKCNLFNDVPLDFEESDDGIDRVQKFNLGNLIMDDKSCTDINLNNIDLSACRWDLWQQALQDLRDLGIYKSVIWENKDGPFSVIPWVRKVVIPVLSLVKSDPVISNSSQALLQRSPADAFGKFKLTRVQGYEPFLTPLLIELGMVDTLMRAELLSRSPSKRHLVDDLPGFQAVLDMPGLVEAFGKIRTKLGFEIDDRFRALGVAEELKRKEKIVEVEAQPTQCCLVQCRKTRARTKFNWRKSEPCDAKTVTNFKAQSVKFTLAPFIAGADNEKSCEDVFKKRTKEELLSAALKCIPACGLAGEIQTVNLVDLIETDNGQCQ